jgi:hypothetical protein
MIIAIFNCLSTNLIQSIKIRVLYSLESTFDQQPIPDFFERTMESSHVFETPGKKKSHMPFGMGL